MKRLLQYGIFLLYQALKWLVGRFHRPPRMIARFLTFLMKDVLRYRRDVVTSNIQQCFADQMSVTELASTVDSFYRHLGQTFVEMLYGHARPMYVMKATQVEGVEQVEEKLAQGKSVILIGSHMANWEWCGMRLGAMLDGRYPTYGVYKPIANPYIDKILQQDRAGLGVALVSMSNTFRVMVSQRSTPTMYIFATDQRPAPNSPGTVATFFGQQMDFINGYVKLVDRLGLEVFFIEQLRQEKGCVARLTYLEDTSNLVQQYVKLLEQNIITQPSTWLWSHDRWRRNREAAQAAANTH